MVILKELTRNINGKEVKFTIRQVTNEYIEPVIQHMYDHFLTREPVCEYSKIIYDPDSLNDFVEAWRGCLSQGLGIVALMEISDKLPVVVGANVTFLKKKTDTVNKGKGVAYNKVLEAVMEFFNKGNIFEKYGVDHFMGAFGLSVHRDFHGLGLGREILRAREPICRNNGIKMTATVFSAEASRYIAKDEGFETLLECDYKNFVFNGNDDFFQPLKGKISLQVLYYK